MENINTISQQLVFFYPVKATIYHRNVGINQCLIKNMLHPLSLKSVVHWSWKHLLLDLKRSTSATKKTHFKIDHDEAFPWSNNNSNHTSGVLLLSQIECLNAELKVFYHYEVFREIGKDMHGQSAGPSYALRREKEGWGGEEGWRGIGEGWGRRNKDLWFQIGKSEQQNYLWYVWIAWFTLANAPQCDWKKRKEKKQKKDFLLFFFFSSGPFAGWGIHRVKGERSTAV